MSNKVTPRLKTVRVPGAEWISLDIGLWPSQGNEMTVMAYYQFKPGHWRPVAAPIDCWELALSKMTELWNEFGCSCKGDPCNTCGGTGWKDFVRWEAAGQQVDSEGYPVLPK